MDCDHKNTFEEREEFLGEVHIVEHCEDCGAERRDVWEVTEYGDWED